MKIEPTLCAGIQAELPHLRPLAQQLAAQLQIPFIEANQKLTANAIYLQYHTDGLHIVSTNAKSKSLSFHIDFSDGLYLRRLQTSDKNQGLAKAVGFKPHYLPRVLDATAGFARDSFTLASLGCRVTMLERSPVLAALLSEAMERVSYDHNVADTLERMQVQCTEAMKYLTQLTPEQAPDVIYLDPMFPERKKKAQVKKEMQILHQLLGSDDHTPYPLQLAINTAKNRVVVKRPKQAEDLNNMEPSFRVTGKASRYDIYLADSD